MKTLFINANLAKAGGKRYAGRRKTLSPLQQVENGGQARQNGEPALG